MGSEFVGRDIVFGLSAMAGRSPAIAVF